MKFKDKYQSLYDSVNNPDNKKIIISNDTFALGELLETLIKQLEYVSQNLK